MLYAYNHSIEIAEISDIVHGQFEDVVIHTASPLPGCASQQDMMNVCCFLDLGVPLELAY